MTKPEMPESDQRGPGERERPVNRYIQPSEYQPPASGRRRWALPGLALGATVVGAVAVAYALWFVLTMRAVELRIEPEPQQVSLSGMTLKLGENWLARPGEYRVTAKHPGYRDLSQDIEVPGEGKARFELSMEPLPGRMTFTSDPKEAEILIDGDPIGTTPISGHALAGGEYELQVRREGYQSEQQMLDVEGLGQAQSLHFDLVPDSAEVRFTSEPSDAEIRVDGEPVGRTPATLRLDAGERRISLSKTDYAVWTDTLEIEGGQSLELPLVELQPAAATLKIRSEPAGATVRIDGQRHATAPVEVELPPDREVTIELAMEGYRTLSRTLTPQANTESTLIGQLVPIDAQLQVFAEPAGAQLLVDGEPVGRVGPQGLELELPAREHELTLRLEDHVTQTRSVRLNAAEPTRVEFELLTELEARLAKLQPLIRAADGQTLKLVEPGRFTMGTPRGQQGRQANEMQHEVELSRLFYMGLHEVTNEQFRQFRDGHSSGIVGDYTLDNDQQPVARVDFAEAAAFCNWLSERDGLEPAYRRERGKYRLIRPVGQGYRLPSEAEWAWVARFAGGRDLKYPWGQSLPPEPNSGNFADQSAKGLVSPTLQGYDDSAPAAARVGSYAPNALGFYDLGGNVSEWIGEDYEIFLSSTSGAVTDPLGDDGGPARVVRGSSWRHADMTRLRLAWRGQASQARDDLGFRIVRYAE